MITVTYIRRKRGENWRRIEGWTEEDPGDRILIGRYVNTRTGTEGGWEEEMVSKKQTRE